MTISDIVSSIIGDFFAYADFNGSNHSVTHTELNSEPNRMNMLRDILPSPIIIENTYRERNQESETSDVDNSKISAFTFPPPENKAPLPPDEASDFLLGFEFPHRPLPLSPLMSAISLPSLLSDVYENVKSPVPAKLSGTEFRERRDVETLRNKPRAQTFTFPPPEVKAPLPPGEDDHSASDRQEMSKPQNHGNVEFKPPKRALPPSPLVSASSLPDILSNEEDTYEKVSSSPYCIHTEQLVAFANGDVAISGQAPLKKALSINGGIGGGNHSVPTETAKYASVNSKAKVERLQSAPMTVKSPEYAQPISPDQRSRFYSYRGLRLPSAGRKLGSLKAPIPLPGEKSQQSVARNSAMKLQNLSESLKSSDHLEHSLDMITEIEEVVNDSEEASPELYLEPVKSKLN